MKAGMPGLVECTTLKELVDLCRELKLDFIELNMNLPYNFITNINPDELRSVTKLYGIEFTMHMPDDADLGSFYESVRKGYVELFSDTIDWARAAGVKLLNLHIVKGARMTLPDRAVYVYDQYSSEFERNFLESLSVLSLKAQEARVTLSIENSSNFGLEYIVQVLDKAIVYPAVKLTWDTGHDCVSGFKDREYLMDHLSSICHMHFHDAVGNRDHLVPGDGSLDIGHLTEFAKRHDITMLIEVKTAEALRKSAEVLRGTWI